MKIKALAFALTLAASTGTGFASSGTFGFGIELDGTGATATNSGVTTLYALDNSGTTRLLPTGSTATLTSSWTGASTGAAPTFNLGTFVLGSGSTLTLDGGAILTFKNGGSDVTSANLNYRITPGIGASGSFASAINLPFNEDNVSGNTGDQRWATEALTTNLLTGLGAGTYTIDVFGAAPSSDGTHFESNTGANFGATFTVQAAAVVPEPGTWAMMIGGLGMLFGFQALRRKSVA
jgi:hypothetical protein